MISIIIPCLNEGWYIDKLLERLRQQTYQDFEVILLDSNSSDNTLEVARGFVEQLPLTIIEHTPRGVAHARNLGAAQAKGEWLLFLDADNDFPNDFIAKMLAEAQARGLTLTTPRFISRSPKLVHRAGVRLSFWYERIFELTKHPIVGGFCILVRRSIHQSTRGFDPQINPGEDLDYAAQAIAAGARFRFATSTYLMFSMRRFEGEGLLRLALKNLYYELYRRTHGYNVRKQIVEYEFGKHGRTKELE
ncbi:MAG TPA: glycosyltransferase family 2 protein [Candidatus Saccharimonadales bacterium]|nr:glycosyltransferase family 2 protein [Candidatus Saccharimonadales bacterium]